MSTPDGPRRPGAGAPERRRESIALLVSRDLDTALAFAGEWRAGGDEVTLVLLDGAASAARPAHRHAGLLAARMEEGVVVAALDEGLRRRGVAVPADGLKVVDLDEVADLVGETADRVVWW